ncbi:MAG: polysaccharide export protein [Deltaproteobacteria bacterium]|nr:polysaccharide export protein [Deltaproteobacteria bacterium]
MKRYSLCVLLVILIICSGGAVNAFAGENRYTIGPGDVIEISVWKDESLTKQIVVPPDGVIAFPLIGDIDVTELTVPQLREIVSKKVKDFVTDATATAMLISANSMNAYVVGKVNKPGQFSITMDTNVMQILGMAGDLTAFASPDDIIILREEKGKAITIPFDYDEVKKGENLSQNIKLKRGDVVVVP